MSLMKVNRPLGPWQCPQTLEIEHGIRTERTTIWADLETNVSVHGCACIWVDLGNRT